MICNLNNRHTYLSIKINNHGKTLHALSLTTESNNGSYKYTGNSNLSFSSKMILLESEDHCDLKFKY